MTENEKLVKMKNDTHTAIKATVLSYKTKGFIKDVNYVFDADDNMACVNCVVSCLSKNYNKVLSESITESIIDVVHSIVQDDCINAYVPEVNIIVDSPVSRMYYRATRKEWC